MTKSYENKRPWVIHGFIGLTAFLLLAVFSSCGPDDEDPEDDPWVLGRGGECSAQTDCFECVDCRRRYGEVCVEGQCWLSGDLDIDDPDGDPLTTNLVVHAGLPHGVDRSEMRSAAIRVFHPLRVDGEAVSCAELLEDPVLIDEDETLNRLRVLQSTLRLNAGDGVAVISASPVPLGGDRLFLVRLHSQTGGAGTLIAKGCTEGVIIENDTDRVAVEALKVE